MDIPVIDWFEEPIKDSIKSVFNGINSKLESLDIFNQYKNTHIELIKHQVNSVKILGMQQPIDLNALYYPATVSTNIRRRIYDSEWKSIDDINKTTKTRALKPTDDGDSYISKNNRVVVLGGPGAGKTTFLKFIALAYLDKAIYEKTKLKSSYLPIYLNLPVVAKDKEDIIDAICKPLQSKHCDYAEDFYINLINKGSCVLLLDSLDEVPLDAKPSLIEKIKAFSKLYPKLKIIISCRTADYEQVFEDFSEVELARLSREGVKAIIKAWFGKDHEKSRKLLTLLENDQTVSSLTETPLLLSLLCIQFKNDLALPKRKTELYRRCVDTLIRDWDTTRGFRRDSSYSQLSDDSKEKIFEAIAGGSCKDSIEYELSENFILKEISNEISRFSLNPNDAKGILREIENHHGILEKCSVETYQFSHGTMQEYFSARYFVAKRMEMEIIKRHYENEGWHNIIVFISSIMDDPSNCLKFLVAKSSMEKFQNYPAFGRRLSHLWLLYRCMAMGVSVSPSIRMEICNHLVKSQTDMLRQLHKDGVLPYAARIKNGVRQPIFYYKNGRVSLDKVLKPYRSLMNEIAMSPIKEYADQVIESVGLITPKTDQKLYARAGMITCLTVPIADAKPQEFIDIMLQYATNIIPKDAESIRSVFSESINLHTSIHKNLV